MQRRAGCLNRASRRAENFGSLLACFRFQPLFVAEESNGWAYWGSSQFNKLPAGWVTSQPGGAIAPNPGWAWSLLILPYIEQQNLYNLIVADGADVVTPNGAWGATAKAASSRPRCRSTAARPTPVG
jgi:hypothetical protein